MERNLSVFTKYVFDNYDVDNEMIRLKYFHSLYVANLMLRLGEELELNNHDLYLAFFLGLTHDLGRFYEIKNKGKMNNLTFDHGSYSNKILFNDGLIHDFNVNEEDYLTIRKALYFHNKKDINKVLNDKEELFCNLLRDADKLDILRVMIERNNLSMKESPNGYVIRSFMHDSSMDINFIHNRSDATVLYLSFIKDLYFNESYNLAMKEYYSKLINQIEVSDDNKELFRIFKEKIKERGRENVREKVRSLKGRSWSL